MGIPVKLQAFEGPLDLLLHLIDKHKIDIYDIPVSLITDQYLEYIQQMREQKMEIASEFLVMAATLLELKSRMLLPKEEKPDEEEEETDPREELVKRLLEYKMVRYQADELRDRSVEASRNLYREQQLPEEVKTYEPPIDYEKLIGKATIESLEKTFQEVLRRQRNRVDTVRSGFGKIEREEYDVAGRERYIRERIARANDLSFRALLEEQPGKEEIIVTFLVVLDMAKSGEIHLIQDENFGEILIRPGMITPEEILRQQGLRPQKAEDTDTEKTEDTDTEKAEENDPAPVEEAGDSSIENADETEVPETEEEAEVPEIEEVAEAPEIAEEAEVPEIEEETEGSVVEEEPEIPESEEPEAEEEPETPVSEGEFEIPVSEEESESAIEEEKPEGSIEEAETPEEHDSCATMASAAGLAHKVYIRLSTESVNSEEEFAASAVNEPVVHQDTFDRPLTETACSEENDHNAIQAESEPEPAGFDELNPAVSEETANPEEIESAEPEEIESAEPDAIDSAEPEAIEPTEPGNNKAAESEDSLDSEKELWKKETSQQPLRRFYLQWAIRWRSAKSRKRWRSRKTGPGRQWNHLTRDTRRTEAACRSIAMMTRYSCQQERTSTNT